MKRFKHEIPAVLLILLLTVATVPSIGTKTSFVQASSSGASLTGNLSSDGGVDSDGDGLFDFLKIDVQVNVTEAGTYRVSISGLRDSSSRYISVSSEKTSYLDAGPRVVSVSLYGTPIYLSGLNPVKVESIYLYDVSGQNLTWLGSVSNIPLSQEYSFTDFERPPASLTGVIFDCGVNTDNDSLYNYLQVSIQVNVTQAGSYYLSISELEDNSNNSIGVYSSNNEYLDLGVRLVNFSLDGRKIQVSGTSPAYVKYVGLNFYGNYSYSDNLYHVPFNNVYSYMDFDPPDAVLTSRIYDSGVDTDGDGEFNYLQVGVEFSVSEYEEYRIEVSGLLTAPTNYSNYIGVGGSASGYFDVGVHVLNISLDGVSIYVSGLNPISVNYVTLYMYNYSSSLYNLPLSREYNYTEFDSPGASLTGEVTDEGIDTDSDGKFNYLQVGVELNVTEAGYYNIGVSRLTDGNYSSIYVYDSEYIYLSQGTQFVYLQLDGLQIRLSHINPRYIDYISLSDQNRSIGSLNRVPLDSAYSYTDFEPPPANLTGNISDMGADIDSDGQFNYLLLEIEVNVTEAGQYTIQVSGLLDANLSTIDVGSSVYVYLDVGVQPIRIWLDGLQINRIGRNPCYVHYVYLRDQSYNTLDTLTQVPLTRQYFYYEFEAPGAVLTGEISDTGVDTDANGKYDYLRIGVEVNVTTSGNYSLTISDLQDASFNYIYVDASNYTFLDVGLRTVYLYLDGTTIYLSGRNPRFVSYISLQDPSSSFYDYRGMMPLGREYSYTEFDPPAAVLTGNINDRGVDVDGDGAFNYLEVGVEINVTKAVTVSLNINGLLDKDGNWIGVYGYTGGNFDVGIHVLNVSLGGPEIYQSHRNPKHVAQISLSADYYTSLQNVPLSKEYHYTWFDFPAALTGVVFDSGVDTDADSYFDYLDVGVQVNVSDAGTYALYISGLYDSNGSYISVYDYKTIQLEKGLQTVDLYLYGPQIHISRLNPIRVSYISLNPQPQDSLYYYYDSINDVPLSREYSYTEFDAPLMDVETKLVVYPDGRVAVEGALKYTNIVPQNSPRYMGLQGTFNITGGDSSAQSSAAMKLTLPPDSAAQFPFNSSTFKMLADYSNGVLDFGVNSSSTLPSSVDSIYPTNSTEGTINATYSGGVLSIQAQGDTTLPSETTHQLPFNSIDITVVGDYSPNTLTGNITFSLLDGFTFDDVRLDFTGNQTHLAVNGTVQVVFNVPLNGFIIHNETELIQLIDDLKSIVPGEGGMVWNMTNGLLNVTDLNIDYVLNGLGASVAFSVDIHGDFIHALAYLLSGGRSEMLLCPTLDEAYDCVLGGSFNMNYSCSSRRAFVKLAFSYDLKRLVDYICTIPEGNMAFAVASNGMYPTLQIGDLIYVEPVSDASSIVADTQNGDIIVFHSPSDPKIFVLHRAVSKTLVNGTVYLQTKGDYNSFPDYWSGNETWNGMVSSRLLVGRVYRRVPIVGALFLYLSSIYSSYGGYSYSGFQSYSGSVTPLWLLKDTVSSVQDISLQLSYNCTSRKFGFSLASVHELKALYENITQKLPQSLPPEIPAEIRELVESLLNTTYASVGSAHVELSYADGEMDFEANAAIEGNLNAQLNHIKDAYFHLMGAYYSQHNMTGTVPWQLELLNQTKVDVNNFKLSARLYENTLEGKIEGLTLMPPLDAFNGTYFTLTRLFNLTTPQYPYEQEFPGQYQMLGITIEGGSNATHGVTLFGNPASVPQPDATDIHQMAWHNSTLGSLQNMVFVIREFSQLDLGWIVGRVVNASSQVPIADASVTVNGAFATTDADGYYIFSSIASGDYGVTVSAPGYVTATKQIHHNPGVTTTANFEVWTEGTVEGMVTDASTGLPISGANITLDGYATKTDADGHYELSVPIGDHTVTAEAADYLSDSKPVHIEAHTTTPLDFTLMATGTLTVTTSPVSGTVFANGTSWGVAPQSRTLEVGTYNVTFGSVVGYKTPAWQLAVVQKGAEASINGVYQPITGTLTVNTTPVSGEVFVNGTSWGRTPQSRIVLVGTYKVTFGEVFGYSIPSFRVVEVHQDTETSVEGVYTVALNSVVAEITDPALVNATHPFVVDSAEVAGTTLSISEISGPITIVVKNVTAPVGVDPPPGTWEVLGNYVQITVNDTNVSVNATIRIYYTPEQLEALGLDESSLKIHYWDTATNEWVAIESHVNTQEHFVWANIDHFSYWALMGQPPVGDIWNFLIVGIVVALIAIILVIVALKKRQRPRPQQEPIQA